MTSLVFDTTALSHFARAGRMDELRMAVAGDEPVLLAEVAAELVQGIQGYPSLGTAASGGLLAVGVGEEWRELGAKNVIFRGLVDGDHRAVEAAFNFFHGSVTSRPSVRTCLAHRAAGWPL